MSDQDAFDRLVQTLREGFIPRKYSRCICFTPTRLECIRLLGAPKIVQLIVSLQSALLGAHAAEIYCTIYEWGELKRIIQAQITPSLKNLITQEKREEVSYNKLRRMAWTVVNKAKRLRVVMNKEKFANIKQRAIVNAE